jgi:hypothetical protein
MGWGLAGWAGGGALHSANMDTLLANINALLINMGTLLANMDSSACNKS